MSILAVAIAAISLPRAASPSPPPSPLPAPDAHVTRHNEYLAVLLPKHLWKSDDLATRCDRFGCSTTFSIFERRHHCRKCGGVFCQACSSRTTRLLDTSSLDFLHPPKGVSISVYDSPISPVIESRVCDDCWGQIHGRNQSTRSSVSSTPSLPSQPSPIFPSGAVDPSSSGESSLCSSVVATPPNGSFLSCASPRKPRSLYTTSSASSIEGLATRPKRMSVRHSHLPLPVELPKERSYGELDAYPLRRSSILCKATGGGRWEPKPCLVYAGYRPPIPGGKAPFEIEMENQEREERLRRLNPVVKDGDFQYRFPKQPEPIIIPSIPYHLATF